MSSNHGIITIQAGMYANFVGTHWWNMQEASFSYDKDAAALLDVNHDVLFREGLNHQNETTFIPRLLCIDLKENFKGTGGGAANAYSEPIQEISELKTNPDNAAGAYRNHPALHNIWDGAVEIQKLHNTGTSTKENNIIGDQGDTQIDQHYPGIVEIYNPERVNVEVPLLLDKQVIGFCRCHLNNDFPQPKPELAPQSWSKFLNASLHPKSSCAIDEHSINDDINNPMNVYGSGIQAYTNENTQNNIEDKLRWFAEECDHLEGFQIIVDAYNGFGGVADCILQHLDDEFMKKTIFTFPVFQNRDPVQSQDTVKRALVHRLCSTLLSFNSYNNHCSFFSPLTVNKDLLSFSTQFTFFPYAHLNPQLLYHSSAILAGSLESITSCYRLKSRQFQMSDITKSMVFFGRKLISSSITMPFPISGTDSLEDIININKKLEYSPCPLIPFFDPEQHKVLSQFGVLRGFPESLLYNSKNSTSCKASAEELFHTYVQKYSPSSLLSVSVFNEKVAVPPPFPNFLCSHLNPSGYFSDQQRAIGTGVERIPISSLLSNNNGTFCLIDSLLNEAEKLHLKSFAKNGDPVIEGDDFNQVLHNLCSFKECYGHDYS